MIIHEMEQRTDEWFEVKKGKFSASDATAIQANGKGLETLVYKKVAELKGAKDGESYINADMERGNELEDLARTAYEIETGRKITQVGFVEMDEYTGCSPDGLVGDDGLAEIKCQNGYKYIELAHIGKIDKKYLDQMQMQMMVSDRKWCDYICFNEGFTKPLIIRVDADPEMYVKLKKGLAAGIKQMKVVLESLK